MTRLLLPSGVAQIFESAAHVLDHYNRHGNWYTLSGLNLIHKGQNRIVAIIEND